ncbi:MAG TPA: RNA-binding cell elongation regulator Jag/EloR [Gaiellaceae bacterium]|nr:RNA-binding cell elongation regulator Jag/EloR [Gaiellaceae bacterium]
MSGELSVEATGETVGEAKWKALRDLERLAPGLDRASVRFQIVSEGERGLLGVGYTPALVIASTDSSQAPQPAEARAGESEQAARVRGLVERVVGALGVVARVDVEETDDEITVVCSGGDLGLLIGKHGHTIDSLQYLANVILHRSSSDKHATIDAAGYRDRRRATLEAIAIRSSERAAAGERVVLEPMSAVERRIVHERLADEPGVRTVSEGVEPNRFVVVEPDA